MLALPRLVWDEVVDDERNAVMTQHRTTEVLHHDFRLDLRLLYAAAHGKHAGALNAS